MESLQDITSDLISEYKKLDGNETLGLVAKIKLKCRIAETLKTIESGKEFEIIESEKGLLEAQPKEAVVAKPIEPDEKKTINVGKGTYGIAHTEKTWFSEKGKYEHVFPTEKSHNYPQNGTINDKVRFAFRKMEEATTQEIINFINFNDSGKVNEGTLKFTVAKMSRLDSGETEKTKKIGKTVFYKLKNNEASQEETPLKEGVTVMPDSFKHLKRVDENGFIYEVGNEVEFADIRGKKKIGKIVEFIGIHSFYKKHIVAIKMEGSTQEYKRQTNEIELLKYR